MSAPKLSAPRRIVVGHTSTGEPAVHDDTVPTVAVPGNFHVAQAFVQTSFDPDPIQAFSGMDAKIDGMVPTEGAVIRWVGMSPLTPLRRILTGPDFPPNVETAMHYTNSIDYLIMTNGTFELVLHDGSKRRLTPGDVVVQLANVHQWNNVGDDWARQSISVSWLVERLS
jgi:quercetin dioxygenase-like cupin family protein